MSRLTLEKGEKIHPLSISANSLGDVSKQNLTRILGTLTAPVHESETEMAFTQAKEIPKGH
jgi:hypothetical protein